MERTIVLFARERCGVMVHVLERPPMDASITRLQGASRAILDIPFPVITTLAQQFQELA